MIRDFGQSLSGIYISVIVEINLYLTSSDSSCVWKSSVHIRCILLIRGIIVIEPLPFIC